MASLRHPNVVLFLGVCFSPPAIITGAPRWLRSSGGAAALHFHGSRLASCACALSSNCRSLLLHPHAEYCSRGSLFDCLRAATQAEVAAAQLSWTRRLSMALDAAKGMLALHSHAPPILHRWASQLLRAAGACGCTGSAPVPCCAACIR